MAQPTSSDALPTPEDSTFTGGTVYPLGAHRFDQGTASDQPVGPKPNEPSEAFPPDQGT